jgi:hypothetical protein
MIFIWSNRWALLLFLFITSYVHKAQLGLLELTRYLVVFEGDTDAQSGCLRPASFTYTGTACILFCNKIFVNLCKNKTFRFNIETFHCRKTKQNKMKIWLVGKNKHQISISESLTEIYRTLFYRRFDDFLANFCENCSC